MELTNLPMFGIMRRRFNWLTQRQQVIARNIANADTPDYRSRDLKPFDAKHELSKQPNFALNVKLTDPAHLSGKTRKANAFREAAERKPYETAPDGNAVVLEEQMVKINETAINHSAMTELYKKHLAMLKIAGESK